MFFKMKKILFIATSDISKRTGGGLACLAYFNAFNALYPGNVDLAIAEEFCVGKYKDSIMIKPRRSISKLIGIFHGEVHRYKSFFKEYLPGVYDQYSYCVINGGVYAGDMIDLFHDYGIKVIVIHHNFEREYTLDNKSLLTLYGLTPFFVIRNERNAYLESDANCFLTESDIELFHRHYGLSKACECLLGTFEPESKDLPLLDQNTVNQNTFVITGSMDAYQSINGIMDFKQRYYPILKENFPDWRIIISGRNPSEKIYQFQQEYAQSIEIIPNPPIMEDVIQKGSIFLCPTCIGGGLKLRLMDGLRMGLPIITHKVSARGYDVFFDSPFFQIYDDEKSFKRAVSVIIDFVKNSKVYHQDIRDIYLSFFSFEAGCKRLNALMDCICSH